MARRKKSSKPAQPQSNTISLRQLRSEAAEFGIDTTGLQRAEVEVKLADAKREQLMPLRQACARKGLDTTGSLEDLQLRLTQAEGDSLGKGHRRLYKGMAIGSVLLGITGLGVLLPHTAAELKLVMGFDSMIFAFLMAIIIDLGIACTKAIHTLFGKFNFPKMLQVTIWGMMLLCLAFSASLNASNFLRHTEPTMLGQCLAVGGAIFISCFVFCAFFIGSSMLMKCEAKTKSDNDLSPAEALRKAADLMDKLQKNAAKVSAA